jgi:hypothetical protein
MNEQLKSVLAKELLSEPSHDFNERLMDKINTKKASTASSSQNHRAFFTILFIIMGLPVIAAISAVLAQDFVPQMDYTPLDFNFTFIKSMLAQLWDEWQVGIVFIMAFAGIRFLGRFENIPLNQRIAIVES